MEEDQVKKIEFSNEIAKQSFGYIRDEINKQIEKTLQSLIGQDTPFEFTKNLSVLYVFFKLSNVYFAGGMEQMGDILEEAGDGARGKELKDYVHSEADRFSDGMNDIVDKFAQMNGDVFKC